MQKKRTHTNTYYPAADTAYTSFNVAKWLIVCQSQEKPDYCNYFN